LTCRWPGCDQPAVNCDIDHSIPYAQGGATHAANLNCKCRTHHLAKTFSGWHERQLADGTLIFTSPAGQTYVTPRAAPCSSRVCATRSAACRHQRPTYRWTTAPSAPP